MLTLYFVKIVDTIIVENEVRDWAIVWLVEENFTMILEPIVLINVNSLHRVQKGSFTTKRI